MTRRAAILSVSFPAAAMAVSQQGEQNQVDAV